MFVFCVLAVSACFYNKNTNMTNIQKKTLENVKACQKQKKMLALYFFKVFQDC